MFVKKSWNPRAKKRYYQYHIAESYRDPETGQTRYRLLMNISKLPPHVIEAIDQSLKQGRAVAGDVDIKTGDTKRGAGVLAIYRAWKQELMDEILSFLTRAERDSVLAMVVQRILNPASKLSLKKHLRDTVLAEAWAQKRLDEDELYRVMDILHRHFYHIQEALEKKHGSAPVLVLYDITSTYFEGTHAEEGEYGYSRDKRWDRYQIVIGLLIRGGCRKIPLNEVGIGRSKRYFPLLRLFGPAPVLSRTEFLRTARLHGAAAFFLDWYVAGPKNVAVYGDAGCHIKKSVLAVDGAPVDTAFHVAVEPAKLVRPRLTTLYRSSKIAKRLLVVSEEDLGPSLETLLSPDGWPGPAA